MTTIMTEAQIAKFYEDGFLIVENFIDAETCALAAERFGPLFSGVYETGRKPDGMNFGQGDAAEAHNKQIDNAWKSDYTLARLSLNRRVGQALAELMRVDGVRVSQDITIWKRPGAQSVYYHQDSTYTSGYEPGHVFSCAINLTNMSDEVGTIEYLKGSHQWPLAPPKAGGDFEAVDDYFYGSDDHRKAVYEAAAEFGKEINEDMFVKINAPAGSVVFHHSHVWHGSGPNVSKTEERKVLVAQVWDMNTKFSNQEPTDPLSRPFWLRKPDNNEMSEEQWPIIWSKDGYRTEWLDEYIEKGQTPS